MTRKLNIQEQTFEVNENVYDQLDIDPLYDPIEYNNYLNNNRLIRSKIKYTRELIKKTCEKCITGSGTEYFIDTDILKLLHRERIKEVDEIQFSDFMLEFRLSIISNTTK